MSNTEPTYSEADIQTKLATLPGWDYEDGWIRRYFKTDGWPITLMLVNTIAFLAEAANHHPDLSVTWARVGVKLSTHSAGGITGKGSDRARKFEEVALWRPAPGGALEGTPSKWVQSGERR